MEKKEELSWAEIKQVVMETSLLQKEHALSMKELDRKWEETGRRFEETKLLFDKLGIKADNINTKVEGIARSNGKFAEEYFFNSLERKKTFAGVHFDYVSNGFKRLLKMPDGSRLEDQFDIVMVNDKAVAIIEIKYKADSDDVEKMVNKKMKNFRILFSDYKDSDIYLGIGSLSFDEHIETKAREYGIGLLKQVGETIEYKADWEVKAY